ncbi:MAG TPA: glycosyltransferase family 39 protein, partial [Candidatus Binatia bacterium]
TLLAHLTFAAFGADPWALRLPAFVAGVLLAPAGYLAARALYNQRVGVVAAALIAASSPLIEYSTNARGYTLVCLFFLLMLAAGAALIERDHPGRWLLWAALGALGFYTIPIMLYPFGIAVVWLGLSIAFELPPAERALRLGSLLLAVGAAALLTFVLYLPVFLGSGLDAVVGNRFVASKRWGAFAAELPASLLSTWRQWNRDLPPALGALLLGGFLLALVCHRRLSAHRVAIAWAAALWLAPVILLQRVVPFERVWLFLLPLYFIVAAAGLVHAFGLLKAKTMRPAVVLPVAAVALSLALGLGAISTRSVYYSNETGTLRDAEAITLFLRGYLRPGDRLLLGIPSDQPLLYYFYRYGVTPEYFIAPLSSSRRVLVLVNLSHGQELARLLERMPFDRSRFGAPKAVRSYDSAVLYQMDRLT